jgi:hypothetical protein
LLGVRIARAKRPEKDAEEQCVWAYLWKVTRRGDTTLDLWTDSREQVTIDTEEFKKMKFEPWCVLLAKPSCTLGTKGAWENKVKAMVNIALLREHYFDGACDGAFSRVDTILSFIYQMSGPSEIIDLGYPSSDGDFDEEWNNDSQVVSVKGEKKSRNTSRGILPQHVATLRKAFPHGIWPIVVNCDGDPTVYYPGKVFIGYYPGARASGELSSSSANDARIKIWARVGKKANENRERFGHVRCFFDGGKIANFRKGNLADNTEFDTPFQLVRYNNQSDKNEQMVWRANRAFCVRAALVDAGYIDGAELSGSVYASLTRIVDAIPRNLHIVETISNNLKAKNEISLQPRRATSIDSVMDSIEGPYTGAHSLLASFQKQPTPTVSSEPPHHHEEQSTSTVSSKRSHQLVDSAEAGPSKSSRTTTTVPNKSQADGVQHSAATRSLQRSLGKQPTSTTLITRPLSTIPTKRPLSHTSSTEARPSPSPRLPTPSLTKPTTVEGRYKLTPHLGKLFSAAKQVSTLQSQIKQLETELAAAKEATDDADLRTETTINKTEQEKEKVSSYVDKYRKLAERFENYVALAKPRLLELGVLETGARALGNGEAVEEEETRVMAERDYSEMFEELENGEW